MPGRNMHASHITMTTLIIEKDIGAKGLQELGLSQSAKEQSLVDPDVPATQSAYYPLMGRRAASRHESSAYWAAGCWILCLQLMQGGEKRLEWSARQRRMRLRSLAGSETAQALAAINTLGAVAKQDGISVEGDSHLLRAGCLTASLSMLCR